MVPRSAACLLVALLVLPTVLAAGGNPCSGVLLAPYGCEKWVTRYNGPALGRDVARDIAVSGDGSRVYQVGESAGVGTGLDYATVAVDASSGAVAWVARFTSSGSTDDRAWAVAVAPDSSRVFVAGTAGTVAYDSSGTQLWSATGNFFTIAVHPAGHTVYASGGGTTAYNATTGSLLWNVADGGRVNVTSDGSHVVVAVNRTVGVRSFAAATGAVEWTSAYAATPADIKTSLDSTAVFVTGYFGDVVTTAYNVTTGVQIWSSSYDGPISGDDKGDALVVTTDGVFVTGWSQTTTGGNGYDVVTIRYDASTGAQSWATRYGHGVGADWGEGIAVSPDGNTVYVAAAVSVTLTEYDYATIAYSASTGSQQWVAVYDHSVALNNWDYAFSVKVNPDGNTVYTSGASQDAALVYDYALAAYSV